MKSHLSVQALLVLVGLVFAQPAVIGGIMGGLYAQNAQIKRSNPFTEEYLAFRPSDLDTAAWRRMTHKLGLLPTQNPLCARQDRKLGSDITVCLRYQFLSPRIADTLEQNFPWGSERAELVPGQLFATYRLQSISSGLVIPAEQLRRYALSAFWQELHPNARESTEIVRPDQFPSPSALIARSALSSAWAWKYAQARDPMLKPMGVITGALVTLDALTWAPAIAFLALGKGEQRWWGAGIGLAAGLTVRMALPGLGLACEAQDRARLWQSGYGLFTK